MLGFSPFYLRGTDMPDGMILPGYRAVLLGSAATLDGLGTITPLEESVAEGTLMLMRLDFAEYPSAEVLAKLEADLKAAGVPPWPGKPYIVYVETAAPSVYLAWQKGIAWMSSIIGILILTVLPALLGVLVWWLLPQELKDLINAMVMSGIVFLMMSFVPKMIGEKAK